MQRSWNRKPATGFKIIYLRQEPNAHQQDSVASYSDFMTGFLTDSVKRTYWGRPVGIAVKQNHLRSSDIYVSSDEGNMFILKLKGNTSWVGLKEQSQEKITVYPNPFTDFLNFRGSLPLLATLRIIDPSGKEVFSGNAAGITELKLDFLRPGIYFMIIESPKGNWHKIIHKINE